MDKFFHLSRHLHNAAHLHTLAACLVGFTNAAFVASEASGGFGCVANGGALGLSPRFEENVPMGHGSLGIPYPPTSNVANISGFQEITYGFVPCTPPLKLNFTSLLYSLIIFPTSCLETFRHPRLYNIEPLVPMHVNDSNVSLWMPLCHCRVVSNKMLQNKKKPFSGWGNAVFSKVQIQLASTCHVHSACDPWKIQR